MKHTPQIKGYYKIYRALTLAAFQNKTVAHMGKIVQAQTHAYTCGSKTVLVK